MKRAALLPSAFAVACTVSLLVACGGSTTAINGNGSGGDGGTTSQKEGGGGATHDTGTGISHVCTPNQIVACSCAGGSPGTQTCASDGSGYGPCGGCASVLPEGGSGLPDSGFGDDAGFSDDSGSDDSGPGDDSGSDDSGPGDDAGSDDAGETGDAATCAENCATENPTAFKSFEGDELQSCACASSTPCASDCTSECATPSTLTESSPCGQCLLQQAEQGESSSCTISAGETCEGNATCKPFVSCVLGC
jgi:hypothetical protein